MPLRSFTQRVEDLVREFKSVAGANLIVERYNPKPDSEEEDAAQLDGVEPQQLMSGEQFYLGVAVSQLDRKQAIADHRAAARAPARVRPDRAPSRASRTGAAEDRPDVRAAGDGRDVQPVHAPELGALGARQRAQARVRRCSEVPMSAKEIDKDINVLLLIHPRDAAAADRVRARPVRAARRQADRLRRSLRLLRPARRPMPGMPPQPARARRLPTLFKAWGVEMDPGKVISDVVFGSGGGAALHADRADAQPHRASAATTSSPASIETLLYAFGGALRGEEPPRAQGRPSCVKSSPNSMLVGQRRRHQVGRRGDQELPALRQGAAARAAPHRASSRPRSPRAPKRPRQDKPRRAARRRCSESAQRELGDPGRRRRSCWPTAPRSTCRTSSAARWWCPPTATSRFAHRHGRAVRRRRR